MNRLEPAERVALLTADDRAVVRLLLATALADHVAANGCDAAPANHVLTLLRAVDDGDFWSDFPGNPLVRRHPMIPEKMLMQLGFFVEILLDEVYGGEIGTFAALATLTKIADFIDQAKLKLIEPFTE